MRVFEHLRTLEAWQSRGRRVCVATIISVEGSAPRDPGSAMLIAQDGELCGALTGGCIEAALVTQAAQALAQGRARAVTYGISDSQAQSVGLSCGGTLEILLDEPEPELVRRLAETLDARAGGVAVRLDKAGLGARLAAFENGAIGTLGNADLDEAVAVELRMVGAGRSAVLRSFGEEGEPHGDIRIFMQRLVSPPRMYVFGAVDFAAPMLRVAKLLGYETILCDARAAFATRARFPDADRIEVSWPDELLAREAIDEHSAVIAMTHDEKFDLPLIRAALATPACYIGVMGSRRTNERRMTQLRELGVAEDQLQRLSAPAGLDVGARTPEEIAVSIASELLALRNGRSGGLLKHGSGPLRGRSP